jgi:hypothetical protein
MAGRVAKLEQEQNKVIQEGMKTLSENLFNIPSIRQDVQARTAELGRITTEKFGASVLDEIDRRTDLETALAKKVKAGDALRAAKEGPGEEQAQIEEQRVDASQVAKQGGPTSIPTDLKSIVGGAGVQGGMQAKFEPGTGLRTVTTPGQTASQAARIGVRAFDVPNALLNLFGGGLKTTTTTPAKQTTETIAQRDEAIAPFVASMAETMRKHGFNDRVTQDRNLENAKRYGPSRAFAIHLQAKNMVQGEQRELALTKAREARTEARAAAAGGRRASDMRADFAEKIRRGGKLTKDEQAAADFLARTDPLKAKLREFLNPGDEPTPTAAPTPTELPFATQKDVEAFFEANRESLPLDPRERDIEIRRRMEATGKFRFKDRLK